MTKSFLMVGTRKLMKNFQKILVSSAPNEERKFQKFDFFEKNACFLAFHNRPHNRYYAVSIIGYTRYRCNRLKAISTSISDPVSSSSLSTARIRTVAKLSNCSFSSTRLCDITVTIISIALLISPV